jgi:hypothetical protein
MSDAGMPPSTEKLRTPPQVARGWGVSPEKVLAFIRSGELRALNLATRLGGRGRYRISPDAITEFETSRAVQPAPKKSPRKRKSASSIVEFF